MNDRRLSADMSTPQPIGIGLLTCNEMHTNDIDMQHARLDTPVYFMRQVAPTERNKHGDGHDEAAKPAKFHPLHATGPCKDAEWAARRDTQTAEEMFRYCDTGAILF